MTKISDILYQLELRCIQQMIRTRAASIALGWGYDVEVPGDCTACICAIEHGLDAADCGDFVRAATHALIHNYNMYPVVFDEEIFYGNVSRFIENYLKYEEFGSEIAMACAILLDRQFYTIAEPANVDTKPIVNQIEEFSRLGNLVAYVQSVVCCVFDAHEILMALAHALQDFDTPFEVYWTRCPMQLHEDVTFRSGSLLPTYVTAIVFAGKSEINKRHYSIINNLLGTQGVTETIKCLLECIDATMFEERYL